MVAPFALMLALVVQTASQAAAVPMSQAAGATGSTAANAEQVARAAQQLPGDATIAAAMRSIRVGRDGDSATPQQTGDEASAAEQALATLGFETALDLQLLAGGPEAVELMSELRASSQLSIAVRAKIRLLVGDTEHLARVSKTSSVPALERPAAADHDHGQAYPHQHRQLQDGANDTDKLSFDAIAIVFSVCVGVCGYLLQAWTSEKASKHASELQREHDKEARELQAEHVRAQAQIRRTERWVDDCCTPVGRALGEYVEARCRFGECHIWFPCSYRTAFLWSSLTGRLSTDSMGCGRLQSQHLRRSWRRHNRRHSPSCTRTTR